MLAAEDISRMSKDERVNAMERLWESFSRDGMEVRSPDWHQQVLTGRTKIADSPDAVWIGVDELQSRLMDR
jgi:hypothetical protein